MNSGVAYYKGEVYNVMRQFKGSNYGNNPKLGNMLTYGVLRCIMKSTEKVSLCF
jgi:hypothetical protein